MSGLQHRAVDLASLGKDLPDKYRQLRKKIEQLISSHSIRSDLDIALDMLNALDTAQDEAERQKALGNMRCWQSDASMALLTSAIILYVRATKTSSRHRYNLDFEKEYTPEQKAVHKKLCALRDDALAHFGPGELDDDLRWHTESAFVPLDNPDDMRIMTGSRRLFKQRQLQETARKQTHRALVLSDKFTQHRNVEVVTEMNRLFDDEEFVDLVSRHHVNLADFFTSEEEAERAMKDRIGRVTGAVNH